MNAVTNAGPLMALAKLGQIELLSKLYQPVWLAAAVHHEVVTRGLEQGFPDALVAQMAVQRGQLFLVNVADSDLSPEILALPLGAGEKQTIHLARQNRANLVLLDDAQARQAAQSFGLTVKGTLGVIVESVRARHLTHTDAKTLIEAILASAHKHREQHQLSLPVTPSDGALENAIVLAPDGGTVRLIGGEYFLERPIFINRSIVLAGAGKHNTFIKCAFSEAMFNFNRQGKLLASDVAFVAPNLAWVKAVGTSSGDVKFRRCQFIECRSGAGSGS